MTYNLPKQPVCLYTSLTKQNRSLANAGRALAIDAYQTLRQASRNVELAEPVGRVMTESVTRSDQPVRHVTS